MARKSRLEPIKIFLMEAYRQASETQEKLAKMEEYEKAAMTKSFKDIIARAIELCGEMKKQ